MDTNPFQTPETGFDVTPAARLPGLPRAEGDFLVVASGTVLPPLCVKTNQPVSQRDLVRKQFDWCSPWVALLILVNLLVLIIVYFIVRKRCSLTFGLAPQVRKAYRRRMLVKIAAVIALFFAIPFSAALDSNIAIVIVVVLLLAGIVALFIGNSPLRVTKYREGMFWIKGFSPEYLAGFKPGLNPGGS
jgi:uncharacterized protein YneF (UPF0154 family)